MSHRWCGAPLCMAALLLLVGCSPAAAPTDAGGNAAADAVAPPPTIPPATVEQLIAVNGTELFVKRVGAGDPIVIVHGGPVLDHGYLLPHLESLASGYELIFYDQRLSGRSAGTVDPESVSLATFVDDIEALRVELGLGRIHLMGHSWGGLLAMRYALRHGDNLRTLILLDSMAASSELWQAEGAAVAELIAPAAQAELDAFRQTEAFQQRQPQAIATMLHMTFRGQFADPAKASQLELYVPDDYVERSTQFGAVGAELADFDFYADLAGVAVATLVLYGDAEPGGTMGGAAIADAIPNARLELVEGAGHFPFIENPPVFLATIREFLAEDSS